MSDVDGPPPLARRRPSKAILREQGVKLRCRASAAPTSTPFRRDQAVRRPSEKVGGTRLGPTTGGRHASSAPAQARVRSHAPEVGLERHPDLGSRGREFKSRQPDGRNLMGSDCRAVGKLPETAEWAPFQEHFRTLRFRPRERRSETAGSGPTVVNEPRCGLAPYRVDESRSGVNASIHLTSG